MRIIFISSLFVQISFLGYAQVDSLDITQIQRINLIDYQNVNYDWYYLTEYAIIPENNVWNFYQTKQKYKPNPYINPERAKKKNPLKNSDEQIFIRQISSDTIQQLFNFIQLTRHNYLDLTHFGIDSLWIENNLDSLYNSFVIYKENNTGLGAIDVDEFDRKSLKDDIKNQFNYYKFIAPMVSSTSDYPTCAIQIIFNNQDTLHIVSQAQGDFMIPWQIYKNNEEKNENLHFSPFIAQWMGNLISYFEGYSNKNRLLGKNLQKHLFEYFSHNLVYNLAEMKGMINQLITPLESIQIRQKEVYNAEILRKWEKDWNVKFIQKNGTQIMCIEKNNIFDFSFEIQIVPSIAKEKELFNIQKDIYKIFKKIEKEKVFKRNKDKIKKIEVNKSYYGSDDYFSVLFRDYRRVNKKNKIPKEFAVFKIYEMNKTHSYWIYDDNQNLFLWKYDEKGVLDLDISKLNGFKRFNTDKQRILLEKVN